MLIYLVFIHSLLFIFFLSIVINFVKQKKNKNKIQNDEYYEKYLKHKYVDNTLHPNTKLVKWSGVGKVVKNPSFKDLRDEVICITGQFEGIDDRQLAVDILINDGINIETNRYFKTATMWVVGHGHTLGSKKLALIKPVDKIILADDFVRIVNTHKGMQKVAPITTDNTSGTYKLK